MDIKDDLIPELELSIIPAENGDLQVELMHREFIKYLVKERNILNTDIVIVKPRELTGFIENLRGMYRLYKRDVLNIKED